MGLALGSLGEGDVTGSEEYDLALWIGRVRAVLAAFPSLLYLTGVDFKTMTTTLSGSRFFFSTIGQPGFNMPDVEVLIANSLYWYIVPVFQLIYALVVADASMYCLHRLGHTNKWIYSKSEVLHLRDVWHIDNL